MEVLPQAIINGVLIGGMYMVVGLGFALCFGVIEIIDLAVGEWVMLGAYTGFFIGQIGPDPLLAIPLAFAIFFPIGYLIYYLAIHRVLKSEVPIPVLMGIVFTFGLLLLIKGLGLYTFGTDYRMATSALQYSIGLFGGLVSISLVKAVNLALALGLVSGLILFLRKTKTGKSIRATFQDEIAAKLMGIKTKRTFAITYGLSLALSATAGVMLSSVVAIYPEMGYLYTTFAFFVVVLAGMGYIPGVIVGGLILGLLQSFVSIYMGGAYTYLAVFFALYMILLISPTGVLRKGQM